MFTVYSLFALVCVDHTCWFGTFRQTQFVCQNYDSYQTHIATSCALQSRLSKSPRQNAHSYYRCALSFKSFAMLLRFKVLNAGARLVVTRLKPNGKLCLDKHHSVFVLLRSSTHTLSLNKGFVYVVSNEHVFRKRIIFFSASLVTHWVFIFVFKIDGSFFPLCRRVGAVGRR